MNSSILELDANTRTFSQVITSLASPKGEDVLHPGMRINFLLNTVILLGQAKIV